MRVLVAPHLPPECLGGKAANANSGFWKSSKGLAVLYAFHYKTKQSNLFCQISSIRFSEWELLIILWDQMHCYSYIYIS